MPALRHRHITVASHSWQECRPALIAIKTVPRAVLLADLRRADMAWSLVPDGDRQMFHEFCCCNRVDAVHVAAMERISALLVELSAVRP